jgi:hypothetical protein
VIAGYWLIGSPSIETRPTMMMDRTVDEIGRLIKD